MGNLSISLEGITQAVNGLGYKEHSKKYKVISAINAFYDSKESINNVKSIDTDQLIKTIWHLEETSIKIKSKRINFSSIKSSINSDLKKLSQKGKNPENIIITDANTFDMSEEAKSNLLDSFGNALKTGEVDIDQATSILAAITDFLDTLEPDEKDNKSNDLIDQIKKVLDKISNNTLPNEKIEDDLEDVEIDDDEEIIEQDEVEDEQEDIEEVELDEIDDEQLDEILDGEIEEDEFDEDTEEIELDEDDEIEDVDDDLEDVEIDDDEEIIEQDEIDDVDEIDEILDEEIEEDELDEDTEEIELDEDISDEKLEQVEGLTEEEIKALEEFNEKKRLAEQFDEKLSEADKQYNIYVTVPAGEYTIGTKKTLKSSLELQKFDMPKVYMGKYPITNSLFEAFVEETGYVTTAEKKGSGNVFFGKYKKQGKRSLWKKNGGSNIIKNACWYQPDGPDSSIHGKKFHPVVQVSTDDAFAFASWIGRRLPTETEWEAASRTDLGYKYPWGNDWEDNACNIDKNGAGGTTAVDNFADYGNEFKICDLLGNTMEWTSDIEKPPIKTKNKQKYNIAKGGGWNSGDDITISSRALFKPGFTSNTIGFRCISEIFNS